MDNVRYMFDTHPAPASDAGEAAYALVRAAAECSAVCTTCADACLSEDGVADLARCVRMCLDCAEICATTGTLIARPGPQDPETLRALLEACATACRACADECGGHADHMEHCRICAESCAACAEACDRMRRAIES